jgi:hypothetical protein
MAGQGGRNPAAGAVGRFLEVEIGRAAVQPFEFSNTRI